MRYRDGSNTRRTRAVRPLTARPVTIALTALLLGACGGGTTGYRPPDAGGPPPPAPCDELSTPVGDGTCRTFAARLDARADTPFREDGRAVTLQVILYRPVDAAPDARLPTVVFHHGSTGDGSDPARFADVFTSKALNEFFLARGWMVAYPQRRGRGGSDGRYDEGFTDDRRGYSCARERALAGAERALADADAAMVWLRARHDVDSTRMLLTGSSRGGVLAVTYLARRPDVALGAINFVGGWLAEGCGDHAAVNRTLLVEGAAFPGPGLWLYAENDSFYRVDYSRELFDAFTAAGGLAQFTVLTRAPGLNGHFVVNDPTLWRPAVERYLDTL